MTKKMKYLNIEQKKELLRQGKKTPLRVKGNGRSLNLIAKLRGTIFDGTLNLRKMGL